MIKKKPKQTTNLSTTQLLRRANRSAKRCSPSRPKCAHGTDTPPFGPCHCLSSCLAWCEHHGETSAPRSSRCSSVSVAPGTPGRSAYLTNARHERTSASVSLKPSEYFMPWPVLVLRLKQKKTKKTTTWMCELCSDWTVALFAADTQKVINSLCLSRKS